MFTHYYKSSGPCILGGEWVYTCYEREKCVPKDSLKFKKLSFLNWNEWICWYDEFKPKYWWYVAKSKRFTELSFKQIKIY